MAFLKILLIGWGCEVEKDMEERSVGKVGEKRLWEELGWKLGNVGTLLQKTYQISYLDPIHNSE